MDEIKELSREEVKWMSRKQELEQKRKGLGPKVAMVDYGGKMEPWEVTPEKMAEIEKVDNEIREAEVNLKEIKQKLSKLPRG